MNKVEKLCLIALLCVTALALSAIAIPALIIIGSMALVLPGLILIASPAIALYGSLFAVPYVAVRIVGLARWKAVILAMLVPIVFGFGLPRQSNAETHANLAAAVVNDISPTQPLQIGGAVALMRDANMDRRHRGDNDCDDLCLRLLFNGNARIVLVSQTDQPSIAYTLERRPVCPPFNQSQDLLNWSGWPNRPVDEKNINWPPPPGLKEIVEARIASGDCLVRVDKRTRPDWTIMRTASQYVSEEGGWSMAPRTAQVEQITVYRHSGSQMQPVGRVTNANASTLSLPLMPTVLGGLENLRWTWSRTTLGGDAWDSVTALRKLVAFNANMPEGPSPTRMRELLAVALADPRRAADDAGLLLANAIAVDIARNGAKAGDAELLAEAIADDRFKSIEFRHEIAEKMGADYSIIVDGAIARFGRLRQSDVATFPSFGLNNIITKMPQTWFARPPASLLNILRDPFVAARASGIIYKLDAGGAAAVPLLVSIVTDAAEWISTIKSDNGAHRDVAQGMNTAVGALCRIGAPARSALNPILAARRKLVGTGGRTTNESLKRYSALWRGEPVNDGFVVTLVSMGVPMTEFRAPDEPSGTVNGSWQGMIMLDVKNNECSF